MCLTSFLPNPSPVKHPRAKAPTKCFDLEQCGMLLLQINPSFRQGITGVAESKSRKHDWWIGSDVMASQSDLENVGLLLWSGVYSQACKCLWCLCWLTVM